MPFLCPRHFRVPNLLRHIFRLKKSSKLILIEHRFGHKKQSVAVSDFSENRGLCPISVLLFSALFKNRQFRTRFHRTQANFFRLQPTSSVTNNPQDRSLHCCFSRFFDCCNRWSRKCLRCWSVRAAKGHDIDGLRKMLRTQMRVPLGFLEPRMTQNLLQIVEAAAVHHKMGRKSVSQVMETVMLTKARLLLGA